MRKLKNEELNRLSIEDYKKAKKLPVVLVLDNIRSLSNIGSIFRTADAFRISKIFLCGITATPPHREIHKTALGATDSVDWMHYNSTENVFKVARENNINLVGYRIFNSYDYSQAKEWLEESQDNYIILFHSSPYPYGQILMREFQSQVHNSDSHIK